MSGRHSRALAPSLVPRKFHLNENPTRLSQQSAATAWADRPFFAAFVVSAAATIASYAVPESYAATVVGLCFLTGTYVLTLRRDATESAGFWGLSLGGLLDPEPLESKKILSSAGRALGVAALAALVVFPPFWIGFRVYYETRGAFRLEALDADFYNAALGQLLVISLPEEAFFRGYLQTALGRKWPPRWSLGGALVGWDIVVTSAIFAVGHFATDPNPTRLAVFFPSLLFGWLRARTGGIGASIAFHAACNVFASLLARGYVLHS